jgi:hypothetical protein
MKNLIRCLLFSLPFFLNVAKAQNIAINTDGSTPDASAMLDIKSTSKGFLAPRMTTTQQNAISSPATGLLIYNTTDNLFRVNTGTPASPVWTALSSAANNWLLTGNSGSNSSTNFLGTADNVTMNFRTNNLQRMMIDSLGRIGIGTSTLNVANPEKLVVDAGTTTSVNAIVGKGSIDSYLQLNIQNNSAGANASSDVVATANNGSETTNYVDMGINGGSNASGVMGAANDAYLFNIGQNLLVGTGSASKSLVFMTGGTAQSTNERMRIDGSGNVGIGVTSPSYKLQVSAASNPLQLTGLQTGTNTDSVLTVSNGVVRRLNASALATSSSNAWALIGNAGTSPSTNFIGTTDAQALVVKENNTQVGRFEANSIALGNGATTNNSTHSYSLGSTATVGFNKTAAMALGNNSAINADSSVAIGTAAVVNGTNSVAIGNGASANNTNSLAIGKNAATAYSITDAVAIGTNATVNYSNAIAIGSNTTSASKTIGNAASSIALGNTATSNSTNAIVIGTGATTGYSLTNPVSIGVSATVNGSNGVAIGNGANIGNVSNATVLGAAASATSTANNSTAVGYNTDVTKSDEIILGDMTNSALSVGIGTEAFSSTNREKLLVDAGTTTSVNAIVGKGSIDNYLQLNIQNNSSGANASSDVVATANNGSETTNYVDMGINGGSNTSGVMGGANDGYLYTMGNNFLLGTGNASKSLIFMTGGTTQSTNERMRIDGSGNVGIGTNLPTANLHVANTGTATNNIAQFLSPNLATTNASYLKLGKALSSGDQADIVYNWTGANSNSNYLGFSFYGKPIYMALTNAGNIGIGSTTPTEKLDIAGNLKFSGALMPNNAAGTSGYVLQSNGAGTAPTWVDPATVGSSSSWALNGNSVASLKNFGTTSNYALPFITNNTEKMRLTTAGKLGIGTSTPNYSLHIHEPTSTGTWMQISNAASGSGGYDGFYYGVNASGAPEIWAENNLDIVTGSGTTNNYSMRINPNGNVGIGTQTFNATYPEKLVVDAGTTTSVNAIVGKGSVNNYLQLNIQNNSSGTNASSDVVATANNGDENTNFVDMGINGGGNTSNVMGSANDGYLYTMGNNFLLGTGNASKSLIFMTGGTTQSANERMRIDGSGNVGIGTNNPTSTFAVTGSHSVSFRSGSGAYTVLSTDHVIINTGGSTPTWTLPGASGCSGRVYRLINHGTTSVTLSQAVTTASGTTSTSLLNTAGSNTYEIISDGTVWRKMN